MERLSVHASHREISLWEAMRDVDEGVLPTAAERSIRGFVRLLEALRTAVETSGAGDAVETMLERSGLIEALEAERTVEAEGRIENLRELVGVAREYETRAEEPSLTGFLQEVSLVADADAVDEERGGGRVTLMTLHNAKGLEFGSVFVMGLEQNLFPHARALEEQTLDEERRLCYVAITRAQERLTLSYARERTIFGNRGHNLPSQFLDEIPADLVQHERSVPTSRFGPGSRGASGGGSDRSASPSPGRPAPARSTASRAPREDIPDLSVGDSVRHEQLGEGVVIGVDRGGQVVVRFAADGSERRLLLAYAPLTRL
jgi:DNA helicase-2/ATP-dependent DNA helicase PcrA